MESLSDDVVIGPDLNVTVYRTNEQISTHTHTHWLNVAGHIKCPLKYLNEPHFVLSLKNFFFSMKDTWILSLFLSPCCLGISIYYSCNYYRWFKWPKTEFIISFETLS